MNVTLTPEIQKFVDEQVRAGYFPSPEAVLEAGLARLMLDSDPEDLDEETMNAVDRADAEFDRGEGIPVDEAFANLRRKHLGK
jgi:Arc/MetJ-type ribon-helix-helix transcriptional regulator